MKKSEKKIDLIIIGGGPSGLTAAIYAARSKLDFLLIEDGLIGGQIKQTYEVENYPGFIKISGEELTDRIYEQAENLGAKIDEFDKILQVKLTDEEKIIETENYIYKTTAVIIATGSKHRELPIQEEKKFHGNGIHYCELCDAKMYEGKDIVVVGGGNSALQGAMYLSKFAKTITIIHQFDTFQADKSNQEELLKNPKVKVIFDSEIRHTLGEDNLEAVVIENLKTRKKTVVKTDGVFVYIGMTPKTDLFKDYIKINRHGYIEAGESTETSVKGVFAAGDVRNKQIRQLTTAVGDGSVAALMAEKYIVNHNKLLEEE